MTTTDPMEEIKVTQADREAAATWYGQQGETADVTRAFQTGMYDWHPLALMLATHRQQAEAAERARIVTWIKRAEQEADLKLMDAKLDKSRRNWAAVAVGLGHALKAIEAGEHLK